MIKAFAVSNYRSLKGIVCPLNNLNVITGPNGSGKSNLYKSLRLLAETANGNLISSIANEGGLDYTFWAGPSTFTKDMKNGSAPGTLRYLLLVAALLTPRPPSLLVLNEPETSLHPDLLPALGRLIIRASKETQVWIVSHASRLVAALEENQECNSVALNKELGETIIVGQGLLNEPAWHWPD